MKTGTYTLLTVLLVLFTGVSHLAAQSKIIKKIKYKIIADGKVKIEEGKNVKESLKIPTTITIGKTTYRVTTIGSRAFEGCIELQSVVLPESLEQIDSCAFKNCINLRSVTFPKNMKSIGISSFEGCTSLLNIELNVEKVNESAFKNCKQLTAILHEANYIDDNAFYECKKVIYYLPKIAKLSDHPDPAEGMSYKSNDTPKTSAYWRTRATAKINYEIKNALEISGFFISNSALHSCKEVELYFPSTIKTIGKNIFSLVAEQGILQINLSKSLQYISKDAFRKSGLITVSLPANVSIGKNAFAECDKLKNITLQESSNNLSTNFSNGHIDFGAFQYCNALENVQFSTHIIELGPNAFAYCSSLSSIQAPGIKKIRYGVFKKCKKLSQVSFSSNLREISDEAFLDCVALKSLQGINKKTYLGSNVFFGSSINLEQLKKSFTYQYYAKVYQTLMDWRKKGEFETTDQWRARVTPEAQKAKTEQLIKEAEEAYLAPYRNAQVTGLLGTYNADQGLYSVTLNADGEIMDKQYIAVPLADAPAVKSSWNQAVITPTWDVYNDMPHASSFTVEVNGKTYRSQDDAPLLASSNLTLDMPLPEIDFGTDTPPANVNNRTTVAAAQPAAPARDNRLDTDIPVTGKSSPNTFAVIIGNENYQHVSHVPHALNDAKVFAAYCQKTLGLPQPNIRSYRDATFGTMLTALADLKSIADAYEGNIQVLFYYAGHGIPNETGSSAYLLPVDANGTQTEACLSLDRLYRELGALKARSVIVFMDACFSGAQRGDGMLVSARGIVVKAKAGRPTGNTVVFSAAQGDETAFPYNEKGHGLFTYYLLEKIRETRGDITLGELTEYVETQVKRQSVVINRKSQTPTVTPSLQIGSEAWKSLRLQ